MNITLKSGISLKVEGFILGNTYGGLLEGSPNKSLNKSIFKEITYPVSSWGSRKVLKIKPEKKHFRKELKPAYYAVWLSSFEPINPEYHGSELVVIWFGDSSNDKSIAEIIENGVKDIDWKKSAQDFYY